MTTGDKLDPEQREAVEAEGGSIGVVAAPGSGKTRIVAARVERLIRSGVHPAQILAVSFTRSAVAEVRERVRTTIGGALGEAVARNAEITTFHALGLKIVRADPVAVELSAAGFNVAREDEAAQAFGSLYEGPLKRPEAPACSPGKLREEMVRWYARGTWPKGAAAILLGVLNHRLREQGLVTQGALVALAVAALERSAKARAAVGTFRHVVLDEAHDATPLQLRLLAAVAPAEGGSRLYVHDPRQRIFGWAGAADEGTLHEAIEAGPQPIRFLGVGRSYRCSRAVARAANAAAARAAKAAHTEYEPMQGTEDPGAASIIYPGDFDRHLAEAIATYGAGNVAVLARSRRQIAELVERHAELQIPAGREGAPRWLRTAEAIARVAVNETDNVAFRWLYDAEEPGYQHRARFHTFAAQSGRARWLIDQYRRDYLGAAGESWSLCGRASALAIAQRHAGGPELPTFRDAAEPAWQFALGRFEDTSPERLTKALAAFDIPEDATLQQGLDALAQRDDADGIRAVAEMGRVCATTVHAAKGREWRAVIVWTDRWPWESREAEEWRTMYVALTRARDEVVIVTADPEGARGFGDEA